VKVKTIKAVISKKHNEIVKSIEDPEVADVFNKSAIYTGGAIASMLSHERVNDFDVYFRSLAAVQVIAQYYIEQYRKQGSGARGGAAGPTLAAVITEDLDGDRYCSIVIGGGGYATAGDDQDPEVAEILEIEGETVEAGTGTDPDQDQDRPKYSPIYFTNNAITLSGGVQIVTRFHGDPAEIHENYDFEHCKGYYCPATGEFDISKAALESLLTRELFYTGSKYPLCSIIRTRKFIKRGWTINAGQYVKMALQLNELQLTHLPTLRDQLTGVDISYFVQLLNHLEERQQDDPGFEVTTPYIIEVIDRIF